jgi:hypothetical protein
VRSESEFQEVLRLVAEGLNDCEIARRTGIPRRTILDWRLGRRKRDRGVDCTKHVEELPRESYAYLLGLYLGDGYIATNARGVYALRIALDERYLNIVLWCMNAMQDVVPGNKVSLVDFGSHVEVKCHWKHWPCLFPQHGPGKKHTRPIVLADWQESIVDEHPKAFVRGLIHSDGTRFMNRVRVRGKDYAYPRYNFTNNSADIRTLFTRACDRLGVEWRQMNATNVSVARRASAAKLDALVGPKH